MNVSMLDENEKMFNEYLKIKDKCKVFDSSEQLPILLCEIEPIMALILSKKLYSISEVRKMTIPLCIKYCLEDQAFLHWISENAYIWEKNKFKLTKG